MKNKFTDGLPHRPYKPLKKILVVWDGFWFVFKNDFSVAYKVVLSLIVLVLAVVYRQLVDVVMIVLATGLMLCMEMMNSCIELICDFFETGYNHKIKVIKDVAATVAGISILVWLVVIVYELSSFVNLVWK